MGENRIHGYSNLYPTVRKRKIRICCDKCKNDDSVSFLGAAEFYYILFLAVLQSSYEYVKYSYSMTIGIYIDRPRDRHTFNQILRIVFSWT